MESDRELWVYTSDREQYQRSIQKQTAWKRERNNAELTLLSNRIGDYWYISQGKTRIPGVNDAADMEETDVSPTPGCAKKSRPTFHVAFHLPLPPPPPFSCFPLSAFLLLLESKAGDGKSWAEVFVTPSRPACESLPPPQSGCGEIGGGKESEGLDSRWEKIRTPTAPAPRSAPTHFFSLASISLGSFCTKYSFATNRESTDDRSIRSVYVYITISNFNRKLFFLSVYLSVFLFFFFFKEIKSVSKMRYL